MNHDKIFAGSVFALIVAVAIAAAAAVVQAEIDLERSGAQAAAVPASAPLVELPPVTVVGKRPSSEAPDASTEIVAQAPDEALVPAR